MPDSASKNQSASRLLSPSLEEGWVCVFMARTSWMQRLLGEFLQEFFLCNTLTEPNALIKSLPPDLIAGISTSLHNLTTLISHTSMEHLITVQRLPPRDIHHDGQACLTFWSKSPFNLTQHNQHEIQQCITESLVTQLMGSLTPVDNARYLSASGPGASFLHNAVPTEAAMIIEDKALQLDVQMRLGLTKCAQPGEPSQCPCGNQYGRLDTNPTHPLHCKLQTRRALTRRHDSISQVIAGVARLAGCSAEIEPISHAFHDGRHPDLLIQIGLKTLLIDITVQDPLAPSRFTKNKTFAQGAQAQEAEKRKYAKYGAAVEKIGAEFLTFAMEPLGLWGKQARSLVGLISDWSAYESNLGYSEFEVRTRLHSVVAVALARGNWLTMHTGRLQVQEAYQKSRVGAPPLRTVDTPASVSCGSAFAMPQQGIGWLGPPIGYSRWSCGYSSNRNSAARNAAAA